MADPVRVTPAHWHPVGFLYADFDLTLDLELTPGAEIDVLLRRVEPRPCRGERLPFHGRFAVLRLHSDGAAAGEGLLTRERALFVPGGGVGVEPGLRSTVWIQGRGRMVRANVAGRWLPWRQVDDDHGSFAVVARRGSASLHTMVIRHLGWPPATPLPWAGAAMGLLLCACGLALGAAPGRLVAGLTLLPVWGVLVHGQVWGGLLPFVVADCAGVVLAIGAVAPLLAVWWLRPSGRVRRTVGWGAAAVACVLLLDQAVRCDDHRRQDRAPPALDLVFGPDSGEDPAHTLAGRVRGPVMVHVPGGAAPAVFLLGGQLQWGMIDQPAQHAELHLQGELRLRGRNAEVVSLPTVDGHTFQQWRMLQLLRSHWRPAVVVLGVPREEAAAEAGGSARTRWSASLGGDGHPLPAPRRPGGLLGHWSAPALAPRSGAADLAATLAEVQAACAELGAALVLALDAGLPQELAAVAAAAASHEVVLLQLSDGMTPEAVGAALGEAIAGLLPP